MQEYLCPIRLDPSLYASILSSLFLTWSTLYIPSSYLQSYLCPSDYKQSISNWQLQLTSNRMLLKEGPPLNSLLKTAQQCQLNNNQYTSSTMGVLIDVTAPLYRQRDKDYITQLKIIDETINEQQVYGVMVKCCSVYIFSQNEKDTRYCDKVGQIIYLDRFIFSVWHNLKLETKYLSRTQSLYCFEAQGEELNIMGTINTTADSYSKLESAINRGLKLHQWFLSFYFSKYHPALGISLMNNYTIMAEPFSIILKFVNKTKSTQHLLTSSMESEEAEIYQFQDANHNLFFIKKNAVKYALPNSEYLLLRGVKCIGHFYQIVLTQTGNILGLPSSLAEHYEYAMNYCAVSRFNERFLQKNHQLCLLSRITYVPPKVTPIAELMKQSDLYQSRQSSRDELRMEDYYMIQGIVINFQGNLHMFHKEHQIIIHPEYIMNLSDDERREMIEEEKISYLYEGILGIIDRSSQGTGKLFNVHLFSNQSRTQFFDPNLISALIKQAGSDFTKQLEKEVKQQIELKLKNLIQKSSFSNPVAMLLEPIKADILIFRLTNTTFQ